MNKFPKDLSGLSFGRLTVISQTNPPEHVKDQTSKYWLCICKCGNKRVIVQKSLTGGTSTSCGCYRKEVSPKNSRKHPKIDTVPTEKELRKFKKLWKDTYEKCYDESHPEFDNVGGQFIIMCEEWDEYACFESDMLQDYMLLLRQRKASEIALERLDTMNDYSKSNCYFVAVGKNSKIPIIVEGVRYDSLSALARAYNQPVARVRQRYVAGKRGIDLVRKVTRIGDDVFTVQTPQKEINSLKEFQELNPHISYATIRERWISGLRGEYLTKPAYYYVDPDKLEEAKHFSKFV